MINLVELNATEEIEKARQKLENIQEIFAKISDLQANN